MFSSIDTVDAGEWSSDSSELDISEGATGSELISRLETRPED